MSRLFPEGGDRREERQHVMLEDKEATSLVMEDKGNDIKCQLWISFNRQTLT